MNKQEAKREFITYLKERKIEFREYLGNGTFGIYMLLSGYEMCLDKVLECSISFYDSCMETRVYYNANANSWIKKEADDLSDMYRLLNYVNAMVWPCTYDGLGGELYEPRYLYTPRFYITEDGNYDLTATTAIDYDHFAMAPLETEDYCTAAIPELMNDLSHPFFFLLKKYISIEDAFDIVNSEVLREKQKD